jgi:hypothetical protein
VEELEVFLGTTVRGSREDRGGEIGEAGAGAGEVGEECVLWTV